MARIVIIGGGFGGLALSLLLARDGHTVTVCEKNERVGGKASVYEQDGFRFDMGPSWYLMPDVFERFFAQVGVTLRDHITLTPLSPGYQIFERGSTVPISIFGHRDPRDRALFGSLEAGADDALDAHLKAAEREYTLAMQHVLYKNVDRWWQFLRPAFLPLIKHLSVFRSMKSLVEAKFRHPMLQKILLYQLVFLGNSPKNAPGLYRLMSHLDFHQGVFYPQGGFGAVVELLRRLAVEAGVEFRENTPVQKIHQTGDRTTGVELLNGEHLSAEIVVSNADRTFTETVLLGRPENRSKKVVRAPSALLFFWGFSRRLPRLTHHTLIFSRAWEQHFSEIFETPVWPTDPSYYICTPSLTDPSVAPEGSENVFVLIPIASHLKRDTAEQDRLRSLVLSELTHLTGVADLESHLVVEQRFDGQDFAARYNATGGSALGLAHTVSQTSIFRPSNRDKTLKNLFFVGADTVPGIGVPMVLISAQLAHERISSVLGR